MTDAKTARNRRRYPRLEGHFRVDLLNMGDDPTISPWESVVEAEALDVSLHGVRVKASYNVSVGSMISLMIYYRGHESVGLCEVVWKREIMGEFIYGLYFKEWSNIDPDLKKRLLALDL